MVSIDNQLTFSTLHIPEPPVDFEVGRIIEVLHRTNLANDTLVFITSDNGPWDVSFALTKLAAKKR